MAGIRTIVACAVAVTLLSGCATTPKAPPPVMRSRHNGQPVLTPVVAVTDFENRAPMQGQWNLGTGMADLLEAELLERQRVIVVERKNLSDVMGEISRQGSQMFRQEGRAQAGRLKNAQYLIRGSITDFTITRRSSLWLRIFSLNMAGHGQEARVALNINVVDVETGEKIASMKASATAVARGAEASIKYKDVAFGGDSFFRTPMGRATEGAISDATRGILKALPERPWVPLVAETGPGGVVIVNGGSNARVHPGQCYVVRGPPRLVTDPNTGNVIEQQGGPVLGRLTVTDVFENSAHARIVAGQAKRGDLLEAAGDGS